MKRKEAKQSVVNITVPVGRPVRDIVETLAKLEDRSLAQYVRRVLQPVIAQEAVRAGLTREAEAAGLQVA